MQTKYLALGLWACGVAAGLQAAEPVPTAKVGLFDRADPLALDVYMDMKALCRDPRRDRCDDLPAELAYRDDDGAERRIEVSLRSRGRFRDETGDCSLPALFVFFRGATAGTLFEGQNMLPLTTHCRTSPQYEQYVLKEHLAYRIYNALTDKSLRTRLARMTYHDTSGRTESLTRYAFFVEHFDSLAERHDAVVWKPEHFDVLRRGPGRDGDARCVRVHDRQHGLVGGVQSQRRADPRRGGPRDGRAVRLRFLRARRRGLRERRAGAAHTQRQAAQLPWRLQAGHGLAARVRGVSGATWRDRALDRLVRAAERQPKTTRSAISTASSKP